MCDICKRNHRVIEITITDNNGSTHYCPNCIIIEASNGRLKLTDNPNLICDITRKPGAVIFESLNEHYTLQSDIMMRLLTYNLTPNEWKTLIKKYNQNNYMLHDDFYDEDGNAIQPVY